MNDAVPSPDVPVRVVTERPKDVPRLVFTRGKAFPKAIAWFGFRSFWGHLWHLAASVIATEDIDARDWMTVTPADDFTALLAGLLGGDETDGEQSLTARLDDDLWIDFIADSGDDAGVSEGVADMLFRPYCLEEDGEELLLPRGSILLFGGDTAYPVATQMEIHNRVSVPFNRVLRERDDGRQRILLGIPGNHDWYDGLDGFARMFKARRGEIGRATRHTRPPEQGEIDATVDKGGQIGHFIDWVEAFRVGDHVDKRPTLPLIGYTPVQSCSYFALKLAPQLDLWGVDRQLRSVDYTQRQFFFEEREREDSGIVLVIADPVTNMLEPHPIGERTLEQLKLSLDDGGPLILTGDNHHYCREALGDTQHVIAGGGGAFLHPARIWRRGLTPPVAEFPGPKASLALALQMPWQIAWGRAGYIIHVGCGLLQLPIALEVLAGGDGFVTSGIITGVATIICSIIAGWRNKPKRRLLIAPVALACGLWVGALPYFVHALIDLLDLHTLVLAITIVISALAGALGFGTYLMVLTILGLEQHQGVASLANPGYKHFLRLRVRRDGSAIDVWALGKVDTLAPEEPVVLVDRFTWENPATRAR